MDKNWDRWLGPALIALWAVWTTLRYWGQWSVDLSALYFSAHFYAQGTLDQVYTNALTPAWLAHRDSFGYGPEIMAPYIYPPWVAAVLSPLTRVFTPQGFFNLGYALNCALLGISVIVAARMFRPPQMLLTVWCAISLTLLETSFVSTLSLTLNQPQILVNLTILLGFFAYLGGLPARAGALLAVAAAIKVTPAVLILLFLADRNWRALIAFALVLGLFVGFNQWIGAAYLNEAFRVTIDRIGDQVLLSRINHSLETLLYVFWAELSGDGFTFITGFEWVDAPGWIDPVARGLSLAGVALGLWMTRALAPQPRLWLRLQIASLCLFLGGPLAWTHYLIFPMILLPGVFLFLSFTGGIAVVAVFAIAFHRTLYDTLVGPDFIAVIPMFWGILWAAALLALMFRLARPTPAP